MSYKNYQVKGVLIFEKGNFIHFSTEITTNDINRIETIIHEKYSYQFPDDKFNVKIKKISFLNLVLEYK